jgi:hypothetical protein
MNVLALMWLKTLYLIYLLLKILIFDKIHFYNILNMTVNNHLKV